MAISLNSAKFTFGSWKRVSFWVQLLVRKKMLRTVNLLGTLCCSLSEKRLITAKYDGQDWSYKTSGITIYYPFYLRKPQTIFKNSHFKTFTKFYEISEGDCVLDIGASHGIEVIKFSQIVGASGLVVAVEADPDVCRRLGKTLNSNGLANVRMMNLAISDIEGHLEIFQTDPSGLTNSIVKPIGVVGIKSVKVPSMTLTNLIQSLGLSRINFCKINVEGAEKVILKSLFDSRETRVENFCISCHDFLSEQLRTFDYVSNTLTKMNYELNYNYSGNMDYLDYYVWARKR